MRRLISESHLAALQNQMRATAFLRRMWASQDTRAAEYLHHWKHERQSMAQKNVEARQRRRTSSE